jgi:type I restriction-modification system DNA methylase subunit
MGTTAAPLPFEADSAQAGRTIWAAANAMRDGGFSTLDTIDHLTMLLFLRLRSADLLADCLGAADPLHEFEDVALPQVKAEAASSASGGWAREAIDGFDLRIDDEALFRRMLELVDELPLSSPDLNGLVYERLIGTLSEAGHLGQYFTPRHIVDLMISLVAPEPGESIYDPACGTGGFFIAAAAREGGAGAARSVECHGSELNRTVFRLCVMNLFIHGIDPSFVERRDALVSPPGEGGYDVVLTNPPFGGSVSAQVDPADFPLPNLGSEGLFLQRILGALRPGGRAAVVCPEGLLGNTGHAAALRRYLMDNASLDAVVSLPGGVFNPYTAVRTGIIVFTKGGSTKTTWLFDVKQDGFSLDARRRPIAGSDLPAVEAAYPDRLAGPRSVLTDRDSIAAHGDRLIAGRYLHDARGDSPANLAPLGEVCDLVKAQIRPAEAPDRVFDYVGMEHVEARTGELLRTEQQLGRDLKSAKFEFKAGDVLYGKLRPYLAKVLLAEADGICSTELLVLRPRPDLVRADYLAEVLRSRRFTEAAVAMTVGANHPRVPPRDLLRLGVPIVDLEEQAALMVKVRDARERIERARSEVRGAYEEIEEIATAAWA